MLVDCHELGLAVRSYYDDIFLVKIPALRPPIVLVLVNYSYILVFLIDFGRVLFNEALSFEKSLRVSRSFRAHKLTNLAGSYKNSLLS